MNADRVNQILKDSDFLACVDVCRAELTKKVMAKTATDEDRDTALAKFHALDDLLAQMRSQAQNSKEHSYE